MMELADRIYVFCLEEDRGIMFYNQSPGSALSAFSGSLPKGVFYSSGEEIAYWDEKINGEKPRQVIKDMVSRSEKVKFVDGECTVRTIIVSKQTFIDIAKQIKKPEMVGCYKRIDFMRLFRTKSDNLNSINKIKK